MGGTPVERGVQNTGRQSLSAGASQENKGVIAIPKDIFPENVGSPSLGLKLPEPDERLESTPQLASCLSLLQMSLPPGDVLEPKARKWREDTEKDKDEQKRLEQMAQEVVRAFKRDEFKDGKAVAEVAHLAPVLDKDIFRSLLQDLYSGIEHCGLLDFHLLEGIAQLIQSTDPGFLSADDLVKILELLSARLQGTHYQSKNHLYELTLAVSHVLDAMAEAKVTELDRKALHAPLSTYLEEMKNSSDPYLVFQAAYAYQALLWVPDNETIWQAAMRRTGKVIQGVTKLATAVNGLDLEKLIKGLEDIQEGLAGVSRIVEISATAYDKISKLVESGQDFMESIKEGFKINQKRSWYSALRGADVLIRDGEFLAFKQLVYRVPCRLDPAFQWGVCKRLGEIAANSAWNLGIRENAIAFLGEIYREDAVWGQEQCIKQWILNILMKLSLSSGVDCKSDCSSIVVSWLLKVD
jgi:hypothetical protein